MARNDGVTGSVLRRIKEEEDAAEAKVRSQRGKRGAERRETRE